MSYTDFIFLIKSSSFMIYPLDLESVSNQRPMLMQSGSTLELCPFLRLFVSLSQCSDLGQSFYQFSCLFCYWGNYFLSH
jgi:hypothetical protein